MKTVRVDVKDDGKIENGIIWDRSDDGESDIVITVITTVDKRVMFILEGSFDDERYILNGGIVTDDEDITAVTTEAITSNKYEQLNKLMGNRLNTKWETLSANEVLEQVRPYGNYASVRGFMPTGRLLQDNYCAIVDSTIEAYGELMNDDVDRFMTKFAPMPNPYSNLFDWLQTKEIAFTFLASYLKALRKDKE